VSETLPEIFERFARDEFHSSSPLYERLSNSVAKDPELLALAAQCRKGERIPNLLFAAVHYLLLKGTSHPSEDFTRVSAAISTGVRTHSPTFALFAWISLNEFAN
jgi:hypothetical protein